MYFFVGLLFVCLVTADVPPNSIQMKIINLAGSPIELFWVNVFQADRPLVKQNNFPIRNSTKTDVRIISPFYQ
jgi:hypothetical protein